MKLDISWYRHDSDSPLLQQTVDQKFVEVCNLFPDSEAVVSLPQKIRLHYSEFNAQVDLLACGLLAIGVARGAKIGIWSTNNVQWLLVQLACARVGAVLVNINPAYTGAELAFALELAEVEILFLIPKFRQNDYIQTLLQILPGAILYQSTEINTPILPKLRTLALYDPNDPLTTSRPTPGFLLWQEVIEAGKGISKQALQRRQSSQSPHDPANIQFTSGTTGRPKAVTLSHHNIVNNAWFTAETMRFTSKDRLCVPVPFYHCFGTVLASLLCFCRGACLVIPSPHFDAEAVLLAIERESCTAVHGVPTMFIAELDHPDFSKYTLSSLRTGIMAGAPCPPTLMQRVIKEMHCSQILIGYGETEASPLTHLTEPDDTFQHRTETVGRNLPHQEVKVVDTGTDVLVKPGITGEICFRGYHLMLGYYRDPEATAKAIDPKGWLHSGDLGAMDNEGYLRITGRLKDMIIRGGENIYPREIEECLYTHPGIAEAAVFAVPDPYWGEEIAAWIKLHPGNKISHEELRTFLRKQLAHFKVPHYIKFVDTFPMTVTGKLQKFKMRKIASEELEHTKNNYG
ncbi:MAG: AMP-binding protein [Proteobacteria bacterium]|nr:AMP-binding protein [Pseudomonadota bacterium]MBU1056897.1 AMP-binding protein [Pseudomonadota bacterium]